MVPLVTTLAATLVTPLTVTPVTPLVTTLAATLVAPLTATLVV